MQRVSETLKLTVIVQRRWSFVVKDQCAQLGEFLLRHIPALYRIL